jgi:ligand-binding sensor domain-containing protein
MENEMFKKSLKILILTFVVGFLLLSSICFAQESWVTHDSVSTDGALPTRRIYSLATDHEGNKWFGTRERIDLGTQAAIVKFDGENWINQNLEFSVGEATDPDKDNRIWVIFVDSKNNIWAGTHGDGVYKFDGSTWSILTTENGLGGNWVRDIIEDEEGNLWFACGPEVNTTPAGEGGLTKFDGETFTTFLSNYSAGKFVGAGNSDLGDNYCYALTFDLQGNLWIGTKGSGVSKLSPEGTFTNYLAQSSGLPDDMINANAADTDIAGNVYVGFSSQGDHGAAIFNGSSWAKIEALDEMRIRAIAHDSQGNIWFGDKGISESSSSGLLMFNANFTSYSFWTTKTSDIASNLINMIELDEEKGEVWIATTKGISVLSGVLQPVAVEDRAPSVVNEFRLAQNYPNPFNPETVIEFSLDKTQHIKLSVYNTTGQLIKVIENTKKSAGIHKAHWNGTDENGNLVSSGIYYYTIETDQGFSQTKKAMLIR